MNKVKELFLGFFSKEKNKFEENKRNAFLIGIILVLLLGGIYYFKKLDDNIPFTEKEKPSIIRPEKNFDIKHRLIQSQKERAVEEKARKEEVLRFQKELSLLKEQIERMNKERNNSQGTLGNGSQQINEMKEKIAKTEQRNKQLEKINRSNQQTLKKIIHHDKENARYQNPDGSFSEFVRKRVPPKPKLHYDKKSNSQKKPIVQANGILAPVDSPGNNTDKKNNLSLSSKSKNIVLITRTNPLPETTPLKKHLRTGILPPGSFGGVSLITGVVASVGEESKKDPLPVLMRISGDFIMPAIRGSAIYKLKGCMLIGSATGNLSAERVYIKITKVSCIDPYKRYIVEGNINAQIADIDKILGMRGEVEYRDGAKFAKVFLTDLVASISNLASISNAGVLAGSVTGSAKNEAIYKSILGHSFSKASKKYADLIIERIKEISPVIEVPSMLNGKPRTGYLIVRNSSSLSWNRY